MGATDRRLAYIKVSYRNNRFVLQTGRLFLCSIASDCISKTESSKYKTYNSNQGEELNRLRRAVKQLQPKYQDVVVYRGYFDMPFREIANVMNISENSAKVLFHRAKEMLRKKMEQ